MKQNLKQLKREQLSENSIPLPVTDVSARLRDIRKALGLTQKQVASILNVPRPAVTRIEKNAESSSLKTLKRLANALHCELMVVVVSREPLDKLIKKQAYKKAVTILKQTYSNMAMEKQSPGKKNYEKRLKELTEELSSNPDSSLWED